MRLCMIMIMFMILELMHATSLIGDDWNNSLTLFDPTTENGGWAACMCRFAVTH